MVPHEPPKKNPPLVAVNGNWTTKSETEAFLQGQLTFLGCCTNVFRRLLDKSLSQQQYLHSMVAIMRRFYLVPPVHSMGFRRLNTGSGTVQLVSKMSYLSPAADDTIAIKPTTSLLPSKAGGHTFRCGPPRIRTGRQNEPVPPPSGSSSVSLLPWNPKDSRGLISENGRAKLLQITGSAAFYAKLRIPPNNDAGRLIFSLKINSRPFRSTGIKKFKCFLS